MRRRSAEPYPDYIIRWDDNVTEQLHYMFLAEAQELFQAKVRHMHFPGHRIIP